MSDSDEESESVSMAGFLFGNIDMKTGQLEDDILDDESKRQLNALHKLGLGSMMSAVMSDGSEHPPKTPMKSKKAKRRRLYDDSSDSDATSDSDTDDDGEEHHSQSSMKSDDFNSELSSEASSSLPPPDKSYFATSSQDDDDYDEEKSPTAVDFSDINELAEEDHTNSQIAKQPSSYLRDSSEDSDDAEYEITDRPGKHVRRLFDDKTLMPPPVTNRVKKISGYESGTESPPKSKSALTLAMEAAASKLETPLAAMMPSKYAGINVSEIFPDFRTGKVLRFSRLFGPGKQSSLPNTWKTVKRRRRKRKILVEGQAAVDLAEERDRERLGWGFKFGDELSSSEEDSSDESSLCSEDSSPSKKYEGRELTGICRVGPAQNVPHASIWRHGPAQLWYDMLNVPEDGENFDYGFQIKKNENEDQDKSSSDEDSNENEAEKENKNGYPDEAFHMITQRDWESEVIWDGSDTKYKKSTKNKAAGWVPSGVNRTAPGAGGSTPGGPSTSSGTSSSLPGTPPGSGGAPRKDEKSAATPSPKSKIIAAAKAAAAQALSSIPGYGDEGGQIDDTWYSIFPVETSELVYGRWEDDVIWDADEVEEVPQPRILSLDPNDENIILCIPDDVDPSAAQGASAPVKVKIPHPHVKKSKILLGKAGVINVIEEDSPPPSPKNDDKDPYNVSNDEYYMPKFTEQSLLKISASGNIIQHSTPVVELRAPFIPTYMSQRGLRAFHRPPMRMFKIDDPKRAAFCPFIHPGPHPVLPLLKHIKKKAKQREQERLAAGGGDIFFMRTPEDLTGKDGELLLVEYCEEHPPLLSQVGMCSKIKNYYKRQVGKDSGPPPTKYGETAFAHSSPFLGVMTAGQMLQTLENNMYRAPIYIHPVNFSDFLVIRTRNNYFIREVDSLFTAGQECPLYEVPGPNSKRANNFVRDFLQVFIFRLFWKSRDNPRRIRMEEIKRAFPMHSESSIRKRLKQCADFKRTGADSNWWVIKPEFRLPTEEEIRAMVSPEQCCAYFSLISAEQRLKDAGYGEKFLFAPQDDDDDENQNKIDDEVKTAPWNTTRAYIQAMKGKCLLQLTGPADPTGCGEGFSYVRVPNKPQTNKEEQEAQPKRIVTGTDADLRRLSLNNAKALLRKFDVPEEEIKKLSRWEVIDVVRTLSTEKAKAGEKGMTKFSRGNRFSVAEHQERYKEECQRIFELQTRILSSSEILSTDEGESSDSELSDIEEMGKNIENIISNKKTNTQVNLEKEEQERRELQKLILGEKTSEDEDKSPRKKKKEEEDSQTLSGLVNHPGRVLKIHRKFKGPDGKEYTRSEIVRKAAIIDIYMRIRTTKDENFIRQFALLDDQAKEEMKKEKRRIQEQLRRLKRNQEKDSSGRDDGAGSGGGSGGMSRPQKNSSPRKKKVKLKPDLKMKCGACGQVGHMRTNKACPLYNNGGGSPSQTSSSGVNVAMTQEEEEEIEKTFDFEDEELVRVDGTKVQLSSKIVKHAEDLKRRTLLLKVPKDAMNIAKRGKKRSKPSTDEHCDYLTKKGKTTNRRRIDPTVVICGIFENILNEIRDMSDSSHFLKPVDTKRFPDYLDKVKNPMDLQTIRENIREKKYTVASDFLADVTMIYENSVMYNGPGGLITEYAQNLLNRCKDKLKEKADQLGNLERMINPLLDNDQVGLAYILNQCLEKLKSMPDNYPFVKPVNKKQIKDYYQHIKKPMDLETMEKKNQDNKYHNRTEFFNDIELIWTNALQYNGPGSLYDQRGSQLMTLANDFLEPFSDQLTTLEENIARSKFNIYEEFGDSQNSDMNFGDSQSGPPSQDNSPPESDEDDADMELVEDAESPGDDGDDELGQLSKTVSDDIDMQFAEDLIRIPLMNSSQSSQELEASMHDSSGVEREEGEYVSDDGGSDNRDSGGADMSMDMDSEQAVAAMLMMGSQQTIFGRRQLPLGAETPRNIHEDLEVSESDEEDSDGGGGGDGGLGSTLSDDDGGDDQNPQQTQQQQPPDDDGLWF